MSVVVYTLAVIGGLGVLAVLAVLAAAFLLGLRSRKEHGHRSFFEGGGYW